MQFYFFIKQFKFLVLFYYIKEVKDFAVTRNIESILNFEHGQYVQLRKNKSLLLVRYGDGDIVRYVILCHSSVCTERHEYSAHKV